jgi:hypothetical protein
MSGAADNDTAPTAELARLEADCQQAARELSSARSVLEAVKLADVTVPSHLKAHVRNTVPTLGRLPRARDMRVEEIVKDQLDSLRRERAYAVKLAARNRFGALDWHVLRSGFPDLYNKAMREANLILERKRKSK